MTLYDQIRDIWATVRKRVCASANSSIKGIYVVKSLTIHHIQGLAEKPAK